MIGVPQAWTSMITQLHAARVAQDVIANPASGQIDRDMATVAYSRAADAVIADLGRLSGAGVLGRITLFLSKRERV